jgi:hypothetical protein
MHTTNHKTRVAFQAGLLATAMVAVLPVGNALARGGGWEFAPFGAYDAACGATVVHVSAVVNREYAWLSTDADGNDVYKVTGSLRIGYATDAGKEVVVNSSGPGHLTLYSDGGHRVQAMGLNSFTFTEEQADALGVPQISVSSGPFDVTWNADDEVSGHLGTIIRDICAELT